MPALTREEERHIIHEVVRKVPPEAFEKSKHLNFVVLISTHDFQFVADFGQEPKVHGTMYNFGRVTDAGQVREKLERGV